MLALAPSMIDFGSYARKSIASDAGHLTLADSSHASSFAFVIRCEACDDIPIPQMIPEERGGAN